MRYFTQFFILCMISAACCCSKGGEAGGSSTEPEAPRALTVTPTSIEATPEAKTQEITIEAPARPKVEIPSAAQSWLSFEDGVFNKYKMTIKLKLAANDGSGYFDCSDNEIMEMLRPYFRNLDI